MVYRIKDDAIEKIFKIQMEKDADKQEDLMRKRSRQRMTFGRGSLAAPDGKPGEPTEPPKPQPVRRNQPKSAATIVPLRFRQEIQEVLRA